MQEGLFDNLDEFDIIKREWQNMPEYNNVKEPEPLVTIKIKFDTIEDYDEFHALLKEYIYIMNNFPLIVKYQVASLGDIKLCLAPNIDNDE